MVIKKLFSSTLALVYALTLMLPLTAFSAEETNSNYSNTKRIPLEDVQRFSNAIGEIKKYYVKPVDDKELFDNAIRGMLTGLDPHSSYLNEEEFKELQTSTSGEFGGLGIEVTMEEGVVKVITPLVDTPAFKAGIKSGDYIIKLGKESVQGLSLKDAVNLMRGKPGTTIELTILRKGVNKPLTFDLIREVIQIKSVKSKMLSEGYGYIRLTQFQALTGKDMIKAIEQLKQQAGGKLKGLVLDLRNNPGGLLDSAIQVSDAFLGNDKAGKQEMIVYTEGRLPGSKFTALANPGDVLDNAPIVVLINNGSASASEIVAGALKDNKRAIILGTKSFGKGSVQTVLPLDGKTGIKLTTALYYTPSGVSIQAKGIIPDIIVEEVDVPKNAVKKDTLAGFTEADLNGHLINKDNSENTESKNNQIQTGDLIHEDYQLYAALTVLEGMALANR
ncbi:TPA: S41 family peptidase [Legionella pneumophila]|uniref:Carboxy-terminal protease n=5 Tax=Gammaproteobacteria TaxID=1236 RepID=Q5ZY73_LEGPH|nr:S41 family peptidase [Legionella pneumophila]ERH41677.1 peptidase S41 [Legionella pneumophila str. Leg01/11]ERH43415.1 peptidase S41 [Legionella pneumophila str. Leg01/53]ERI47493.1 peptidase S41 [Legionella pneumophila str. Leg01/20]AAU26596.1 carboxy-terminal protease [Legionella pneumophila subsp. pneumophila str. Philadelphia 1]AEW50780.1 carboxy-terminal protease [Legionella pneumophila subsp. pneumophila ATCC 43290]